MKRALVFLIVITCFAAVLRLYHLGKTPVSMEWDEVALGYDAYSILKTGKDQFGTFLPNNFRSLDDWKPPLYVYMTVPWVAVFGLTDFATRLPSALFGILAVVLTYYLVQELFRNEEDYMRKRMGLLSSLFLSISPWHLQFSRAAFETNLSVTVTITAVLTFLVGIRGKPRIFIFSSVLFGLALFSYHSTRVVTPLLLISLFVLFRPALPGKKLVGTFLAIYFVFWVFFLPIATSPDSQIRFRVTNDLNVYENQEKSARLILNDSLLGEDAEFAGRLFHNRRISIFNYENAKKVTANYLSHFFPKFLFVEGDAPLHHAPGFGMMYFFDFPLLIFGLLSYVLRFRKRENFILLVWLLVAPLPASVTWQAPHSVRGEIILPTLQIFSAIGAVWLYYSIRKEAKSYAAFFSIIGFGAIMWGVGAYLHQYYAHTNIELSKNWLYGRKEAVTFTESVKDHYNAVWVSMKVDMPYIFWLYYSKYPPEKYLSEGGTVSGGFADERNGFDSYQFRNFRYNELPSFPRLLLVGVPQEFPPDAKIVKTLYYLDGSKALVIAENRL